MPLPRVEQHASLGFLHLPAASPRAGGILSRSCSKPCRHFCCRVDGPARSPPERQPILIVCPNSVMSNWQREFSTWGVRCCGCLRQTPCSEHPMALLHHCADASVQQLCQHHCWSVCCQPTLRCIAKAHILVLCDRLVQGSQVPWHFQGRCAAGGEARRVRGAFFFSADRRNIRPVKLDSVIGRIINFTFCSSK